MSVAGPGRPGERAARDRPESAPAGRVTAGKYTPGLCQSGKWGRSEFLLRQMRRLYGDTQSAGSYVACAHGVGSALTLAGPNLFFQPTTGRITFSFDYHIL